METNGVGDLKIKADKEKVYNAFNNLIRNAIQHMRKNIPDGDKVLSITFNRSGDKLEVLITNPGHITNLKTMCEPFKSSDAESVGLGLPTAYDHIQAHPGASIRLKNNLREKRVEVHIHFPLLDGEKSQ